MPDIQTLTQPVFFSFFLSFPVTFPSLPSSQTKTSPNAKEPYHYRCRPPDCRDYRLRPARRQSNAGKNRNRILHERTGNLSPEREFPVRRMDTRKSKPATDFYIKF